MISIVLSAYNGSKYIKEQLDSLFLQNKIADQVLIVDDCSEDDTANIISHYIDQNNCDNWSLNCNDVNKGWKENFRNLIISADGDYIFPCDQDDIWKPEKVKSMTEIMNAHPEIDVLACSVEPFYELGAQKTSAGRVEAAKNNTEVLAPQHVDDKALYIQRPGCSYCVRKSFVNQIKPYWPDGYAHDAILWILSEVKGSLFLYNRRLMRFRRHEGNASARKEITRGSRIDDITYQISKVQLMERFGQDYGCLSEDKKAILDDINCWLMARKEFLESRSVRAFSTLISRRNFYRTWRGLAIDVALGMLKDRSI